MLKLPSLDLTATNDSEKTAASFPETSVTTYRTTHLPTQKHGSFIVHGHEMLRTLNIYKCNIYESVHRKYITTYPTRCNVTQFIYIWKLPYMFRVVPPSIIRSANNCIYSICYLSHCFCYLPLSWKSWNWFECAVGGVRHPQHTPVPTLPR